MKRYIIWFCFCVISCGVNARARFSTINRLIRAEVTPYKNSLRGADGVEEVSRVTFKFERPFYYEKREAVPGRQVRLYFPGINLSDFTQLRAIEKIRSIHVIENAFLHYERVPVPRVVLVINFAKDAAILRFTKENEANLLVIDIFEKEVLELLRRQSTTIRYACNGTAKKKRLCCRKNT